MRYFWRFWHEGASCLHAVPESEEGSARPFRQSDHAWAKKFATKTTSVSPSSEQFGTSPCEQSICLFLFLLSSVFRPRLSKREGRLMANFLHYSLPLDNTLVTRKNRLLLSAASKGIPKPQQFSSFSEHVPSISLHRPSQTLGKKKCMQRNSMNSSAKKIRKGVKVTERPLTPPHNSSRSDQHPKSLHQTLLLSPALREKRIQSDETCLETLSCTHFVLHTMHNVFYTGMQRFCVGTCASCTQSPPEMVCIEPAEV